MTDSDREARDRTAAGVHQHDPADDTADIDELVQDMRRGTGLGGKTLGEEGTTGGTTVGRDLQKEMETGTNTSGRIPGGHPYDPGMAGRTARGGLGSDLNRDVSTPDEDDEATDENPSPS